MQLRPWVNPQVWRAFAFLSYLYMHYKELVSFLLMLLEKKVGKQRHDDERTFQERSYMHISQSRGSLKGPNFQTFSCTCFLSSKFHSLFLFPLIREILHGSIVQYYFPLFNSTSPVASLLLVAADHAIINFCRETFLNCF